MQPKRQVLKKTEDINIELCYFEDMPYVAYYTIETEDLFYSQDLPGVNMRCKNKYNLADMKDVTTDMAVEFLMEDHKRYVRLYNEGVEKDNPRKCTVYHNKRDLVRQSMKIVLSMRFSNMAIYEYLVDTYSYIEDGFEYMYIFLENMVSVIKDQVLEKVKKDLKEYQNVTSDKVVVYRGFNQYSREDGTSFTFSLDIAKQFAFRWGENGYVNKYEVNVEDIIAYVHHEEEIITNNANLLEVNVI